MADTPTGPSADQMMALLRASQGQGGNGCAPLLMGARLETNVGQGCSIQNGGLNFNATFKAVRGKKQGGVCKDLGFSVDALMESFKKIAQAGAPQQCSIADITGQSHGLGGSSFTDIFGSGPRIGHNEIG